MLLLKTTTYDFQGNIETTVIQYKNILWCFYNVVNDYISNHYDVEYKVEFNGNCALIYFKDLNCLYKKLEICVLGQSEED